VFFGSVCWNWLINWAENNKNEPLTLKIKAVTGCNGNAVKLRNLTRFYSHTKSQRHKEKKKTALLGGFVPLCESFLF